MRHKFSTLNCDVKRPDRRASGETLRLGLQPTYSCDRNIVELQSSVDAVATELTLKITDTRKVTDAVLCAYCGKPFRAGTTPDARVQSGLEARTEHVAPIAVDVVLIVVECDQCQPQQQYNGHMPGMWTVIWRHKISVWTYTLLTRILSPLYRRMC